MKFAYADPPYLGCCRRYNHFHGDDGRCWDLIETHKMLIQRLVSEFPDGWALSLTSPNLKTILPLCPDDVRIASWCKSFCAFKKGVRPAYAWEPVIFRGGRNPSNGFKHDPPQRKGVQTTPKDFLVEPITLEKGLTGAKPARFCRWILDLLNVQIGDEVVDLFQGTGIMTFIANEVLQIDGQQGLFD